MNEPVIDVRSYGTYAKIYVTTFEPLRWNTARKLADDFVRKLFGDDYRTIYHTMNRGRSSISFQLTLVSIGPDPVNVRCGNFNSNDRTINYV